jgi:hypothetical protein
VRTTHSLTFISGCFNGPIAGTEVPLALDPAFVGMTIGTVIQNKSKETTGALTAINAASVTADISFSPGDFYEITLGTPWVLQTTDGIVVDVECKQCGFCFPPSELIEGVCRVCFDDPDEA